MTALWRQSPVCETELAGYCRMSDSSMNRLMDRMEAKMLMRRKTPMTSGEFWSSWRVQLLPQLGFHELNLKFKLGDPWDSPHNKQRLAQMPDIFSAPGVFGRRRRMSFRWGRLFSLERGSSNSPRIVQILTDVTMRSAAPDMTTFIAISNHR